MKKKEYWLIGLATTLFAVYVVFFSNWFTPKTMTIEHSTRSARAVAGNRGAKLPTPGGLSLTFALHGHYSLTSVKVVPADAFKTNRFAYPVWHLVSAKGSPKIDGFAFGFPIQGMQPSVAGAAPDPLLPGVRYTLLVETPQLKGEHDFALPGANAPGR